MSKLWCPSVEIDSYGGTSVVPLETRMLINRRLFINGVIDADTANEFIAMLIFLTSDSNEPVTIYINSPGGEVMSGLMIYDAICGADAPIVTVCTGMAASMAAILLAAGQHGRRYIMPHGKVLIHEPLISDLDGGSATSVMRISKSLLKTRDVLSEILADHTGKSLKEINSALADNSFMDAGKAIDFGLCDHFTESLIIKA